MKEVPMSAEYPPYDPNKEYVVYERFQHNGVVAECTPCNRHAICRDCAVRSSCPDDYNKCMAASREDKTSVYYKVLTDVRP